MSGLGRLTPPDWEHIEKHPLTVELTVPTPVVFGINWYEGFDRPVKGTDGRFRIKIAGSIRGGHCISSEQAGGQQDAWAWHVFYDQGEEGACTGFGTSRALTLLTGKTYDAFWQYDDARRIDGDFPSGEGSYVRSAFAAQKKWGDHFETGAHCTRTPWHRNAPGKFISSYKWVTSADQVRAALGYPGTVGEIPLLNSWGTSYPETVYIDLADVDRLLNEEGEAGLPVLQ